MFFIRDLVEPLGVSNASSLVGLCLLLWSNQRKNRRLMLCLPEHRSQFVSATQSWFLFCGPKEQVNNIFIYIQSIFCLDKKTEEKRINTNPSCDFESR